MEKILIADDVEFARGILKMLLNREYEIIEAADGHEAVAAIRKYGTELACILLDIKMPGLDGFGVLDFMRTTGIINAIPVIVITAATDAAGHIRCYESGAFDLIEKPYDEELLLYKLRFNITRFRANCNVKPVPPALPARLSPRTAVCNRFIADFSLDQAEADAMFQSFFRAFTDCATRLRQQLENPDFMIIREVTHDIFGFARSAGVNELDDLALLLNTAAKAASVPAVKAGIRLILALYSTFND